MDDVQHGDPRLPERFWSKTRIDAETGCWVWTAASTTDGYPHFALNGKAVRSHRHAYATLVGPIGEGLQVDHLCRVTLCVNPAHLEPVTGKVNTMRGETPAAINAAKSHCPKGHAYDDENTYQRPDGVHRRECKECKREYNRAYYHRTKGGPS